MERAAPLSTRTAGPPEARKPPPSVTIPLMPFLAFLLVVVGATLGVLPGHDWDAMAGYLIGAGFGYPMWRCGR